MARSYDKFLSRFKTSRSSKGPGPARPGARDLLPNAAKASTGPTGPIDHVAAAGAIGRPPGKEFIWYPPAAPGNPEHALLAGGKDGVDYDLMEAVMDRLGIDKEAAMKSGRPSGQTPIKPPAKQQPDDGVQPTHHQPLGGRPNTRNQWLDSYAVGMNRTGGDDADDKAGLPEWIETLDDYRRWASGAMDDQGRPAFEHHADEAAEDEPTTLDLDVTPDAALAPPQPSSWRRWKRT